MQIKHPVLDQRLEYPQSQSHVTLFRRSNRQNGAQGWQKIIELGKFLPGRLFLRGST
jgi:hypothetical protein